MGTSTSRSTAFWRGLRRRPRRTLASRRRSTRLSATFSPTTPRCTRPTPTPSSSAAAAPTRLPPKTPRAASVASRQSPRTIFGARHLPTTTTLSTAQYHAHQSTVIIPMPTTDTLGFVDQTVENVTNNLFRKKKKKKKKKKRKLATTILPQIKPTCVL